MSWYRFGLAALLMAVVGCDSLSGVDANTRVAVRADDEGLVVRNYTPGTIYTFAIDRETAALTNWVRCMDPGKCKGIRSWENGRIPAHLITDWDKSRDIMVTWWQLEPAPGGGYRVGLSGYVVVRR